MWGLDWSGSLQGAGGVGGLLGSHQVSGAVWSLPAYDGNGNVMALFKRSTSETLAAYEYDAFGQTIAAYGSGAESNPFRFSTKFTDTESTLVYYGFRYYSSSLGRFITRDPIGERGGLNLYGFLTNGAVNKWDLLGMVWVRIPKSTQSGTDTGRGASGNTQTTDSEYDDWIWVDDDSGTVNAGRMTVRPDGGMPDFDPHIALNNFVLVNIFEAPTGNATDSGGGLVGAGEGSTQQNSNNPSEKRCAELMEKYGRYLGAQSGAFFDNRKDAQIAALLNAGLGSKLSDDEPYEYSSMVLDARHLWGSGATSDYFVTPAFSNWMLGLPRTIGAGGPAVTNVERDPWYQIATSLTSIGQRADGVRGINFPALLDLAHSHPPSARFQPSYGDYDNAFMRYPTSQWIVDYDQGIINYGMKGSPAERWREASNIVPQQDIQDMRGCFGNSR